MLPAAPTWACEFPGLESSCLVSALKRLGFAGVGETALGAQAVCKSSRGHFRKPKRGCLFPQPA